MYVFISSIAFQILNNNEQYQDLLSGNGLFLFNNCARYTYEPKFREKAKIFYIINGTK